ncbi:V-set and immunoglobulin domain-containing protein 4 isoform X2 [Rana temporaria]|uniref:V-set and immunoglobulin domain-containing protein 4 isoform X2 n=1 Tax=Rana temporaria TaxID=8407 RepID=UPI001AADA8D9|nr:V-set and immunoglobulin domain-containing protein 4 isoform X2 [Rana temporaria]
MAHRRMMGHTGWLVVFVFVYGFGSGLCDISLTMEKTVTGYRRESVVIPCTYKASNNEDIIKIEWEFQSHLVIYRADEQDHIPLSKYRERAVISKSPSGDVSLTLRRLDMDDRGNFKCKVTGRDRNGKLITQEHVTILKVLRKKGETPDVDSGENDFWTTRPPTEQPKVTTAEDAVTTKVLITTKPDVRVSTSGEETFTEDNVSSSDEHEEIITTKIPHVVTGTFITVNSDVEVSSVGEEPKLTTENVVTETPHMETEQTTRQNVKTRIFITVIPDVKVSSVGKEPDLTTVNQISNIDDHNKKITPTKNSQTVTGASNEDDSAIARTKQPRKFHSSSFPAFSFTTPVMHNNPPAEAIKTGSGIFFYTLIIGLLCIVSVLIVTIVLIARRKKTKSHNYNLPTMNQLALNLEGRSCEAASNSYEPDFPVSQYEQLPMCSNEYEQLVLKNPEGNDSQCQSSK